MAIARATQICVLALLLEILEPQRATAQNRLTYRFEDYNEDGPRMHVQTQGAYGEFEINPRVTARAQFVYDAISGASPTGGYPAPDSNGQVPLNQFPINDIRRAEMGEVSIRYGANNRLMITPQFVHSLESDYSSYAPALTHTIDFNNRNTTLNLGISHNFDSVRGTLHPEWTPKNTTDFLVGISQLLGPKTYITANLTFGYASGYLNDPYKGVNFYYPYPGLPPEDYPTEVNSAENRPGYRFKQVFFFSVNHFVEPLNGAIEASYRLYHDDWDIVGNNLTFSWIQKFGSRVRLSPFVRWYRQSAASFYAPRFIGDPAYPDGVNVAFKDGEFVDFEGGPAYPSDPTGYQIVSVPPLPEYYSADYRLSELNTWTVGVQLHVQLQEHASLEFAYKRYTMNGLDNITPSSAYPKANVFTIGASLWF